MTPQERAAIEALVREVSSLSDQELEIRLGALLSAETAPAAPPCDDHRPDGPDPYPGCRCAEIDRLMAARAPASDPGPRDPTDSKCRCGRVEFGNDFPVRYEAAYLRHSAAECGVRPSALARPAAAAPVEPAPPPACGSAGPTGAHCTLPADHSDDQCSGVTSSGAPSQWSRQLSRIATGANKKDRAMRMPDDKAALHAMFDAYQRLRELGWREAQYCPKDGTEFQIIEAGSTGVFEAYYEGEWPDGHIISHDGSDSYSSRPGGVLLFRPPAPAAPSPGPMQLAGGLLVTSEELQARKVMHVPLFSGAASPGQREHEWIDRPWPIHCKACEARYDPRLQGAPCPGGAPGPGGEQTARATEIAGAQGAPGGVEQASAPDPGAQP